MAAQLGCVDLDSSPSSRQVPDLAGGVGWLLSETGVPRRIKSAYLTDEDIAYLAAYAAHLRHGSEAA